VTTLKVIQRRSKNGASKRQRDTLRSLGLKRIRHSVQHEDTPQVRGMVDKVKHLVEVSEDG
jgi:large subunit ribosomal protein L30